MASGVTSARILQTCGNTRHGAQNQIGNICALLWSKHVIPYTKLRQGMHLRNRENINKWQTQTDNRTKHTTVLQRPLVTAHRDAGGVVRDEQGIPQLPESTVVRIIAEVASDTLPAVN